MSFKLLVISLAVLFGLVGSSFAAWGFGSSDPGKVLLKDVQVLTLHSGKMTTGRRSSPVPQLNCVGGSASGKFKPSTVQCYNRGFDGMDIQWECKADMDNSFRFGNVEVACEGYDYPDDPYILKGSCGLEYTLDYTMEGQEKQRGHDYGYSSGNTGWNTGKKSGTNYFDKSTSGGFGDLILLFVIAVVIYGIYKICLSGNNQEMGDRQYSSTNDDRPEGGFPGTGGGGWFNPRSYGNNAGNQYTRGAPDASCGAGAANRPGTGGFWTGMATGGMLGYMFGNRGGNTGYYNRPNYGGGWTGGSYSSSGGGGGSTSTGGGSTGTRTASGFGGTRRR